jgi:hypothetical protein
MEDLSLGIVSFQGPSAMPRLLHVLHARAVYLMVYLVCRESQGGGSYGASLGRDSGGHANAQVRFADCS